MSTLKRLFGAGAVILGMGGSPGLVAQEAAVVVLIDRDSIVATTAENGGFSTQDVNEELAAVGMRDALPVFRRSIGQSLRLSTGGPGNAGWHTLTSVPATWKSAADEDDGLSNFVLAGPGLGSPDANENRTRLLRDAGLSSLSAENISALHSRIVCGVVFKDDLTPAASGADLTGATLGLVAFRVAGVDGNSVLVESLDAQEVCSGALTLPAAKPPTP